MKKRKLIDVQFNGIKMPLFYRLSADNKIWLKVLLLQLEMDEHI